MTGRQQLISFGWVVSILITLVVGTEIGKKQGAGCEPLPSVSSDGVE